MHRRKAEEGAAVDSEVVLLLVGMLMPEITHTLTWRVP